MAIRPLSFFALHFSLFALHFSLFALHFSLFALHFSLPPYQYYTKHPHYDNHLEQVMEEGIMYLCLAPP